MKHQPSVEVVHKCACGWQHSAAADPKKKPPAEIRCRACGKWAKVVEVGK